MREETAKGPEKGIVKPFPEPKCPSQYPVTGGQGDKNTIIPGCQSYVSLFQ